MVSETANSTDETTTFVVHGVGAPKAHPTEIDAATWEFATTWGRRNRVDLDCRTAVAHPALGPSIAYGVLEGRLEDGRKHRIVELQWADLSRTSPGVLGTVIAFFKILFGLRTIVEATARSLAPAHRPSSSIARWILFLLLGPVFGLNLWLAVATLAASTWPLNDAPAAAILASIAFISFLPLVSTRLRPIPCFLYLALAGLLAVVVGFLPPLLYHPELQTPFMHHAFALASLLNVLWLAISLLVIVLLVYWFVARRGSRPQNRHSLDAQVFTTAAALRAWSLAIPLLSLLVLETALRPGGMNTGMREDVEAMKRVLVPTLGMNWVMLALISLAFAVTFLRFRRRTASSPGSSARLIIGALAKWTVIATTFVFSIGVVWFWYDLALRQIDWSKGTPYAIPFETEQWHDRVYHLGWAIAGLLFSTLVLLREQVRMAMDFILDVIHYFAGEHGQSDVSRRVIARFEAVVKSATSGRRTEISFVAHSLGSVWVADYLRHHGRGNERLVTMGSPISHLFEHYCPGWFWPDGAPRRPAHLCAWLNLYRNSDYIGRHVDPADDNLVIGDGFHTGYFGDERVHRQLEARGWIPSRA